METIGLLGNEGIADALYVASAVVSLQAADPTRRYVAAVHGEKVAWQRLIMRDAPFGVFGEGVGRGAGREVRWLRVAPELLRAGVHVIDAHTERPARVLGLPWPARRAAELAYFGPRPPRSAAAVAVYNSPAVGVKGKFWTRGPALVEELAALGIAAELTPMFRDPEAGVSWLSARSAFVGPDTGLTHLAAALGVPTILLLGGRFEPANFRLPGVRVVTSSACALGPCRFWLRERRSGIKRPRCAPGPDGRGIACVEAIQVEPVARLVIDALREQPAWE